MVLMIPVLAVAGTEEISADIAAAGKVQTFTQIAFPMIKPGRALRLCGVKPVFGGRRGLENAFVRRENRVEKSCGYVYNFTGMKN